MNASDLIDYLARFKPDSRVEFIIRDSDGYNAKIDDPTLDFSSNSPSIKFELEI